jgi:hypothetical protein
VRGLKCSGMNEAESNRGMGQAAWTQRPGPIRVTLCLLSEGLHWRHSARGPYEATTLRLDNAGLPTLIKARAGGSEAGPQRRRLDGQQSLRREIDVTESRATCPKGGRRFLASTALTGGLRFMHKAKINILKRAGRGEAFLHI